MPSVFRKSGRAPPRRRRNSVSPRRIEERADAAATARNARLHLTSAGGSGVLSPSARWRARLDPRAASATGRSAGPSFGSERKRGSAGRRGVAATRRAAAASGRL
jgi:hypothetical protein